MSGGTTSDGTDKYDPVQEWFDEVDLARSRGAVSYSSGSRKINFAGPPPPVVTKVPETVVQELDFAQREQVIADWLGRQGLDHERLNAIIEREMEAMSA